jgi:hypothetical protein
VFKLHSLRWILFPINGETGEMSALGQKPTFGSALPRIT